MGITSILFAFFLTAAQPAVQQTVPAPKIEAVDVRNNRRIPGDTIKYNIQTKAADTLNPDVIRRDIKTLYAQLKDAMADAGFTKRIETFGMEPALSTPQELQQWIRSELDRWTKVVHEAGIQADRG